MTLETGCLKIDTLVEDFVKNFLVQGKTINPEDHDWAEYIIGYGYSVDNALEALDVLLQECYLIKAGVAV